jgi:hypothetical protein
MKLRVLLLAAVSAFAMPSAAQAALVTLNFTGHITSASGGAYNVNDVINLSMTLDTSVPGTPVPASLGTQADYLSAVKSIAFGSNSMTLGGDVFSLAYVQNDRSTGLPATTDAGFFQVGLESAVSQYMFLNFSTTTNLAVVDSLALPDSQFDPLLFTTRTASFSSYNYETGSSFNYVAQIDAVQAVPEPSTWAMMLIGFAALGFTAYRRSKKAVVAA